MRTFTKLATAAVLGIGAVGLSIAPAYAAAPGTGPEWSADAPGTGPEWSADAPGTGPEWSADAPGTGPEWDPENTRPGSADLVSALLGGLFGR